MELAKQIELLAQGSGFDQWGDFLVVAIMAALWLAGGLAKVVASKKTGQRAPRQGGSARQQQGPRESWRQRLARKAKEIQEAAEARARELERQANSQAPVQTPTETRTRPPAGKITIRHGRRGDSVMVYERPPAQPKPTQDRRPIRPPARQTMPPPAQEPLGVQSREVVPEPIQPQQPVIAELPSPSLGLGAIPPASAGTQAGIQPRDIIDYNDPDALRKAILHYEILGKPLALRESSEPSPTW